MRHRRKFELVVPVSRTLPCNLLPDAGHDGLERLKRGPSICVGKVISPEDEDVIGQVEVGLIVEMIEPLVC